MVCSNLLRYGWFHAGYSVLKSLLARSKGVLPIDRKSFLAVMKVGPLYSK